jgi:hypothetical protein
MINWSWVSSMNIFIKRKTGQEVQTFSKFSTLEKLLNSKPGFLVFPKIPHAQECLPDFVIQAGDARGDASPNRS